MALAIVAEGNAACKIAYCRVCLDIFKQNEGRGRHRKRCKPCQSAYKRTKPRVYKHVYKPNRVSKPSPQRFTCLHCLRSFHPKRTNNNQFCSRECALEKRREETKQRATERHPYSSVWFRDCPVCDKTFAANRINRKYCSDSCSKRAALQHLFEAAAKAKGQEPRICIECQAPFTPTYGDKRRSFCSKTCKIKAARRVRKPIERARKKAATVEPVDPFKVFDRDGWRCQICHKPTPRRHRGSLNDNAPELDHIVPLARGGEHSYRNTQCACRKCNGRKSDSVYGQLHLFVA